MIRFWQGLSNRRRFKAEAQLKALLVQPERGPLIERLSTLLKTTR